MDTALFYSAFVYPYLAFIVGLWAFVLLRAWWRTRRLHHFTQGLTMALASITLILVAVLTMVNQGDAVRLAVRIAWWIVAASMTIDTLLLWRPPRVAQERQ